MDIKQPQHSPLFYVNNILILYIFIRLVRWLHNALQSSKSSFSSL